MLTNNAKVDDLLLILQSLSLRKIGQNTGFFGIYFPVEDSDLSRKNVGQKKTPILALFTKCIILIFSKHFHLKVITSFSNTKKLNIL